MSLNDTTRWIVTYDIRDARRGIAVHRYLKGRGVPLQYSVFTVEASAAQIQKLMLHLEDLIAVEVDDVRAYRWATQAECHRLGTSLVPDDTLIDAQPAPPIRRKAPAPA